MAHQHKIIELRSYLQRVIVGQQNLLDSLIIGLLPAGRCGLKALSIVVNVASTLGRYES